MDSDILHQGIKNRNLGHKNSSLADLYARLDRLSNHSENNHSESNGSGSNNFWKGKKVILPSEWKKIAKRPAIQYMLRNFRRYLIQEYLDEINNRNKKKFEPSNNTLFHNIRWIESLLQTPIRDHRKYCIWRILAPYFVNVRRLSDEEALFLVMRWLEKCDGIRKLSFYPRYRAKYDILNARRGRFYPIALNDLKKGNQDLYNLLMEEEYNILFEDPDPVEALQSWSDCSPVIYETLS